MRDRQPFRVWTLMRDRQRIHWCKTDAVDRRKCALSGTRSATIVRMMSPLRPQPDAPPTLLGITKPVPSTPGSGADASIAPAPGVRASIAPAPGVRASVTPAPGVRASVTPAPGVRASVTPAPGVRASVTARYNISGIRTLIVACVVAAAILIGGSAGAAGSGDGERHDATTPPALWNPQGKESPEPYGYDVYTAPDLPWGYVDPADPPAVLDSSIFAPALRDPSVHDPAFRDPTLRDPTLGDPALRDPELRDPNDPDRVHRTGRRGGLDVTTTVDRTAYSWFGAIEVTADVRISDAPITDCDSVVAVSAVNPRVRAYLRDDGVDPDEVAGDGRYTGTFDIGAGVGEARPTGTYAVTAMAFRGGDAGLDEAPTFSVYSVRRWTGITTIDLPDGSDR